jgi:hypothetical protein
MDSKMSGKPASCGGASLASIHPGAYKPYPHSPPCPEEGRRSFPALGSSLFWRRQLLLVQAELFLLPSLPQAQAGRKRELPSGLPL